MYASSARTAAISSAEPLPLPSGNRVGGCGDGGVVLRIEANPFPRASVATGRLGLFASMSLFVVLVMASWAALTTLLDLSVAGMNYAPSWRRFRPPSPG